MRIGVLIVVLCLQVYSALVILPLLSEVKSRLLNSTADKIKQAFSLTYNIGSLMEIFGDSRRRNASLDNQTGLFKAGLDFLPK
uniref:Uncharacterized protein n=1 Tax=Drosophila melanogaster TaxID=7227 RepID=A0A0B4K7I9_DROME|nr:uncharacterized protein Dmel_CG43267 [Drosophila melanogaster]AFH07938.1 uncharacterized protein Dmel_CG43267 [Drosophila melanogaster]|eukprot:NP_001246183.1 uncharacterized protein Dmel_CG43267 [Drosophila melanogaster]